MSPTSNSASQWPALNSGIESRTLTINDLQMHVLEAKPSKNGVATDGQPPSPLVILLHGFPELAYSWRKVLGPLAEAGYHVVAPDQRGYGRTKSAAQNQSTIRYEDDLDSFRMTNLVKDVVTLVYTLGYQSVAAIVGHDFGSPVAAYCALIRPDIFKSVVMMSSPFAGPPKLSLGKPPTSPTLARLDPPRKHYGLYYSTPEANAHMMDPPGGLHAFLRENYHVKSADSKHTTPHPLSAPTPSVMAELPHYYIMLMHETMPQSVHGSGPSAEEIQNNKWLTEGELGVFPAWSSDRELFSGMQINVPAMFMAGKQDWGTYQFPGAAEAMREKACKNMVDFVLIDGAGHWVQQEQSGAVVEHLLRFLNKVQQ
ncbi:alpha/beta hydrolase fold protein [Mycena sp. CBHHK59/15]|nr:alpha/beta hydrolase fold protein [Mycena sp. CBHHK59/15]